MVDLPFSPRLLDDRFAVSLCLFLAGLSPPPRLSPCHSAFCVSIYDHPSICDIFFCKIASAFCDPVFLLSFTVDARVQAAKPNETSFNRPAVRRSWTWMKDDCTLSSGSEGGWEGGGRTFTRLLINFPCFPLPLTLGGFPWGSSKVTSCSIRSM